VSAPAKILVRAAEGRDADLVVGLIRQLAAYEKLEEQCVATEEQVRRTLLGKDRCAETLLVFSGEVAAGFAVYFFSYSTFLAKPGLYLEDLFVKPEFRGQGLGKALFAELIKVAAARGCGRMEWSVLDWNEPAMAFYERIGALPQREWIRYRLDEEQISRLAVDGIFR
jgi:GNAT superfamily N-acetyltransferase